MLNKPRGLVTSVNDERGRDTVYACLREAGLPWLAPVGRLDKASEGLLLFSKDPEWAARITEPESSPGKDRKTVASGKRVSGRVDLCVSGILQNRHRKFIIQV